METSTGNQIIGNRTGVLFGEFSVNPERCELAQTVIDPVRTSGAGGLQGKRTASRGPQKRLRDHPDVSVNPGLCG